MKKCIYCDAENSTSDRWYKGPKCSACYLKEYNKRNKAKVKRKWHKAYNKNKTALKGYYRERHIEKYGITEAVYLQLLESQNSVCKICKKPDDYKPLSIDHCHTTGAVRGLLCTRCNMGLGLFKDNKDFLKRAIEYLEESQSVSHKS